MPVTGSAVRRRAGARDGEGGLGEFLRVEKVVAQEVPDEDVMESIAIEVEAVDLPHVDHEAATGQFPAGKAQPTGLEADEAFVPVEQVPADPADAALGQIDRVIPILQGKRNRRDIAPLGGETARFPFGDASSEIMNLCVTHPVELLSGHAAFQAIGIGSVDAYRAGFVRGEVTHPFLEGHLVDTIPKRPGQSATPAVLFQPDVHEDGRGLAGKHCLQLGCRDFMPLVHPMDKEPIPLFLKGKAKNPARGRVTAS